MPDHGFASIGYGLPGGMAVSLSAPGRAVVASSGDGGGFNMKLGGLETARQAGCGLNPRNI
jgi:acetolactate synthase-1/2/3 large subunit